MRAIARGPLVLLSQKVAFYEVGWNQLNGEIHVSTEAAMVHRRSGTIESRFRASPSTSAIFRGCSNSMASNQRRSGSVMQLRRVMLALTYTTPGRDIFLSRHPPSPQQAQPGQQSLVFNAKMLRSVARLQEMLRMPCRLLRTMLRTTRTITLARSTTCQMLRLLRSSRLTGALNAAAMAR